MKELRVVYVLWGSITCAVLVSAMMVWKSGTPDAHTACKFDVKLDAMHRDMAEWMRGPPRIPHTAPPPANEQVAAWFTTIGPHAWSGADQLVAAALDQGPLEPGCLILDVGANVCQYSIRLLDTTPCDVWAFEPVPKYASWCIDRLAVYGSRFRLHPAALCDKNAVVEIHVDRSNLGWNTLVASKADAGMDSLFIVCIDPAPLFQTDLARLRAIKIDVEGAEQYVLAGLKPVMARPDWHAVPMLVELGWGTGHPQFSGTKAILEWMFAHAGYQRTKYEGQGTNDIMLKPERRSE